MDIGSAYGRLVIECAQMGAQAYRIERERELIDLALANALNETGHIKLIHSDVLDAKVTEETDRRPFDLIVLNDVLGTHLNRKHEKRFEMWRDFVPAHGDSYLRTSVCEFENGLSH